MRVKTINKKQIRNKIIGHRFHTVFFVFILFLTLNLFSQKTNSFFVEGNKLYQQEKYSEAITQYLLIEKSQEHSIELYYNLGNAYYKTNKIAPAIYYYEKALQLDSKNKDVIVNLAFAKRATLDNIEELPTSVLTKISKQTMRKLHFDTWAYIAVLLSFVFAILFLVYHFSDSTTKKRVYFITGTMSFIFMLLSVFFAYQTSFLSKNKKEAIVFASQSAIKTAPLLSSETIFKLHEGTKVSVLESVDNWKKVKISDGQTGWIIGSEIKEL